MAGTLTISTLSDGTNSTSTTNAILGSAKAWVNFNGATTAAIRTSHNVGSVVRNGQGDYTVNFTNALADANFVPLITHTPDQNGSVYQGNWQVMPHFSRLNSTSALALPTTTSFKFSTNWNTTAYPDPLYCMVAIFR